VQLLQQLTDPVLEPARRLIPPIGMIDISATVVMLILWFIANALMGV
jgi:YggT family protein